MLSWDLQSESDLREEMRVIDNLSDIYMYDRWLAKHFKVSRPTMDQNPKQVNKWDKEKALSNLDIFI